MTENFWTDKYPEGVAAEIDPDQYPNVQAVLKQSCQRFADKPAFTNLGKTIPTASCTSCPVISRPTCSSTPISSPATASPCNCPTFCNTRSWCSAPCVPA